MNHDHRIKTRRRTAMTAGLLAIALLSATACIFDQSDYKGGGRLDRGATAATATASADGSTEDPTTQPQEDAASGLDAAGAGD